jgi:hypothetical protein
VTAPDAPASAAHQALHDAVVARMAADRQARDFPAPALDAIDATVRRRTAVGRHADLSSPIRALQAAADIDIAPPVASEHRGRRGVKLAIAKATGWYVGYLAVQVRELGFASARAMRSLSTQLEEIERRIAALEERNGAGDRP